ncbi:receptor-like protein Cf-9 [Prosopis cineraria]|uniref:receptor-like protein Cf-9 n=1 Tax=Prosopis cineraria TaxID=364024 RepID=UPI00240F747A|nr:receptor-like protein Cf-9 [Prosopis cineraria]
MAWFSLSSVLCLQLFLMHSFSSSLSFPLCRPDQSSALLHFKNSFSIIKLDSDPFFESYYIFIGCEDDNIIPYSKTSSWRNGTNCCLWDGVTCNLLGHVISLNLNCSRLQGKILPDNSLFRLTHLQRLDLAGNDFKGSQLLSNFSQFVSLTHLRLGLGFSGEVPAQISYLNKLVSLYLFYPVSFKPNTWERLLKNATHIEDIWLEGVDMSSISPTHLFKNLSSSLISLSIAEAGLQGHLGDEIFSFPHIQEIGLLFNKNLTGCLPKSNWSNSLQELNLASCQFTGKIPKSFWNHTQIIELELSDNDFVGQISPSLSNLQNLTRLSLSSNNFNGPFPSSISKLKNLEYVGLDENGFQGHLPNQITVFPLLQCLYLSNNLLNGAIPSWVFTLPSLESLDISSNQFTGQMGEISSYSLEFLNVSDNKLSDLSNNSLQGEPTASICNATSLGFLSLSHNCFTGTIPHCISSSLEILNLSHNKFTGTIPHYIGSSSLALSVLDLQMNKFSGSIPESFEEGNNLRTLNLNGNLLGGSFPRSLVNCTKLKVLDLGRNGIEDAFPHWLHALQELQVLVLRQNKLHGLIPSFMDEAKLAFPKLRVLDLSNNNFSGPLPATFFKSFKAMRNADEGEYGLHYMGYDKYNSRAHYEDSIEVTVKGLYIHFEKILTVFTTIDVSNNMFEGKLPQVIGELGALKAINFSHNRLNGAIPSSIGNLRNLESLDLSSNKLRGKIPPQLASLDSLGYLNLSQNELEGCIPMVPHFETFSLDFFKGNKALRGFQLHIPCVTHEKSEPPLPSSSFDAMFFEFGWKPILLGYICGTSFGASMFWVMIFLGKPQCIPSMVNNLIRKWRTRVNRRCT